MSIERDEFEIKTPEEAEVEGKANGYIVRSSIIIWWNGLNKKLGIPESERELFTAGFAESLCVKEAADNKRKLHSESYIAAEAAHRVDYMEGIDHKILIDELTAQTLKENTEEQKENFDTTASVHTPFQITSTANFLSSVYLECRDKGLSFRRKVKKRLPFINNSFLKKERVEQEA